MMLILMVLSAFAFRGTLMAKTGPVLVELFTSEGCSSCPPADTLLAELDRTTNAEVITLSEHVDYWNRLGWTDPFSSAAYSRRQEDYARRFRLSSIYTPQMVVDGSQEMVGSDRSKVVKTVAEASKHPKIPVSIQIGQASPARVKVDVGVPAFEKSGPAEIILAVTEGPLQTRVTGGENAGHVLNHVSVVRKWLALGRIASPVPFHDAPLVALDAGWDPRHVKVVVFVQELGTGRILGAASIPLQGE